MLKIKYDQRLIECKNECVHYRDYKVAVSEYYFHINILFVPASGRHKADNYEKTCKYDVNDRCWFKTSIVWS